VGHMAAADDDDEDEDEENENDWEEFGEHWDAPEEAPRGGTQTLSARAAHHRSEAARLEAEVDTLEAEADGLEAEGAPLPPPPPLHRRMLRRPHVPPPPPPPPPPLLPRAPLREPEEMQLLEEMSFAELVRRS
jgi:hypothetical protein